MAPKPIQIVDENDRPLRAGTMSEAWQNGLWHRIVFILVEDEKGRILLQKRSATMALFPGYWTTSASGHVDAGEDYAVAAKRELLEETGLEASSLEEIESYKSKDTYEGRMLNRFNKTYKIRMPADQHVVPDRQEVAELHWFSKQELADLLNKHPDKVTDSLKRAFPLLT